MGGSDTDQLQLTFTLMGEWSVRGNGVWGRGEEANKAMECESQSWRTSLRAS